MLGAGTFGAVYRATQCRPHGLRQPVALKVLRPDLHHGLVRRFRDEARLLGLLQHAGIVRVFELGELSSGEWFVAMERVDGPDLEWVGGQVGPLPPEVVWQVGSVVACALDYAWSHVPENGEPLRLEHRDVKPANILVTPRGEVKVLDFGLARARFPTREARTEVGGAFGTVPYMSPDRWTGVDDPSNDVFALGATLAQLIAGLPPTGEASFAVQQKWRERCLAAAEERAGARAGELLRAMCAAKLRHRPTAETAREALRGLRDAGPDPMPWFHRSVPLLADARTLRQGPLSHQRVRPIRSGDAESPTAPLGSAYADTPVPEPTLSATLPEHRVAFPPPPSSRARVVAAVAVGLLAASAAVNLALALLLVLVAVRLVG